MKRYVFFLLQQAFEIWVWYQALLLFLGSGTSEYSVNELFWYYVISVFLTIAAMGIVYWPRRDKHAKNETSAHYPPVFGNKKKSWKEKTVNSILWLIIFVTVIVPALPQLWETVSGGLTNSIFPAVPPLLIFGLFCYKLVIHLIISQTTKKPTGIEKKASHLLWQLFAFFVTVIILASLESYHLATISYQDFLLLAIPITIVFDFLVMLYEKPQT
jgi:hypothetical protein